MTRRRALAVSAIGAVAVVAAAAAAIGLGVLPNGLPGLPHGSSAGASGGPSHPPVGDRTTGPIPRLVDETRSSGLDFTYDGPFPFAVGGGLAVFDCDADGRPDVYLAGGEGSAALFRNTSPVGGSLTFERVASPVTDLGAVNGAYPIDIDSDGRPDLVVIRNGERDVLRGLGGCRFESIRQAWNLAGPLGERARTEAFSATWEAGQAWPTLAFGNYVDPENKDFQTWCQPNELVRPAGAAAGTAASASGAGT